MRPASWFKLGGAISLHRAIPSVSRRTAVKTFVQRSTTAATLLGNGALIAMLALTSLLFVRPF
jgi:hypothetical protein